jgi:hypothetical protein
MLFAGLVIKLVSQYLLHLQGVVLHSPHFSFIGGERV